MEIRIKERRKDEKYFDLLMSGCSATFIIQVPKKVYVGWIGDS